MQYGSLSTADRNPRLIKAVTLAQRMSPLFEHQLAHLSADLSGMSSHYAACQLMEEKLLDIRMHKDGQGQLPLPEWSGNVASFPSGKLIHELFEEQVERVPDETAVVCEGKSLTYSGLNRRANQVAHCLRARGLGPDQRVGICVERSLEMVVGMLGILKAGGAYVPLDPSYPAARLAYLLEDAAPSQLLIDERFRNLLPQTALSAIALDDDCSEIREERSENLQLRNQGLCSSHLAYVIYTSGSTGQPKGVMVEHRNVVSLWHSLENIYRRSAECQRVAVNASFSFDASVKQFVQLLSGRTIVLIPQRTRLDTPRLMDYIDENNVNAIDCTPSQLRAWIAEGLLERSRRQLRMVLIGGEAIDPALWTRLTRSPDIDFYNVYGPTESTVDATAVRLQDAAVPHIGRPIEHRLIYILDPRRQPVPSGVAGEIYIGGAGLARGYLSRPKLTAERFIANPFSAEANARLYKTGDMGRWRPDGAIEYVGRNDHQIKIRGHRIELAEIEAQLVLHEYINGAVVVAREDVFGEKWLVAYVVMRNEDGVGASPGVHGLQEYLRKALPEYMVPSVFVSLDRLPLTTNGKLDRTALPEPEGGPFATQEYEPPQGALEAAVAGIWQELLRVGHIGRHDNFFALGGHSLLAARIIMHVGDLLEVDLPLNILFEQPTVARLSDWIAREIAAEVSVEVS